MITSDLNTFYVDGVLDHANGVLFIQSLVDNQTISIDDVREFARAFTGCTSNDDTGSEVLDFGDSDDEPIDYGEEEMPPPYVTPPWGENHMFRDLHVRAEVIEVVIPEGVCERVY